MPYPRYGSSGGSGGRRDDYYGGRNHDNRGGGPGGVVRIKGKGRESGIEELKLRYYYYYSPNLGIPNLTSYYLTLRELIFGLKMARSSF